jgi:hypothetical protein
VPFLYQAFILSFKHQLKMTQMPSDKLHQLIQTISEKLAEPDKRLIDELNREIVKLRNKQPSQQVSSQPRPEIDPSSGCYRFDGDNNFYCPHCFDRLQQRVTTQRINRLLRVCTQCHTSLKPSKK